MDKKGYLLISLCAVAFRLVTAQSNESDSANPKSSGTRIEWDQSTLQRLAPRGGRSFPASPDKEAKWNAIALWDENTVVATSAINFDDGPIGAWMILGRIVVD